MNKSRHRLTVVGTGNAGLTAAYHLSLHGNHVCLYGAGGFDEQIDMIQDKGGIQALAEFNGVQLSLPGFQGIHTLTKDIREAAEYANIIVMPVPAFAQATLFKSMLPHLRDGQILLLMPGNYGSLVLRKMMEEAGYDKLEITFVDAMTIPWACRIVGEAEIAIYGLKKYLPVASLPASRVNEATETLQNQLPLRLTPLKNVVAAGLENINFGGHPLLTVLNMGLLENFEGNFNFYRDCCSEATAKAAAVLDKERLAVGHALGFDLMPELEAMNRLYGLNCQTVHDINRTSETHGKLKSAPRNSQDRYISEDVPYVLVPCYELARLAGVSTPILEACIRIAGVYNDADYFVEGRTLPKMGLSHMSIRQIMEFVV